MAAELPSLAQQHFSRDAAYLMSMMFPSNCFDLETLKLMSGAFDAAWGEVGFELAIRDVDPTAVRAVMAIRIMTAVRDGERDPEHLTELAIEAIARAY